MGNVKAQEASCLTEGVWFSVIIPSASLVANYLRKAKEVNCFSIHLKSRVHLNKPKERERERER